MNLFVTQISKREMEGKADVLSWADMRREEVRSSVEHLSMRFGLNSHNNAQFPSKMGTCLVENGEVGLEIHL